MSSSPPTSHSVSSSAVHICAACRSVCPSCGSGSLCSRRSFLCAGRERMRRTFSSASSEGWGRRPGKRRMDGERKGRPAGARSRCICSEETCPRPRLGGQALLWVWTWRLFALQVGQEDNSKPFCLKTLKSVALAAWKHRGHFDAPVSGVSGPERRLVLDQPLLVLEKSPQYLSRLAWTLQGQQRFCSCLPGWPWKLWVVTGPAESIVPNYPEGRHSRSSVAGVWGSVCTGEAPSASKETQHRIIEHSFLRDPPLCIPAPSASLQRRWLKTMTETNFRAQFLWRRNMQRDPWLQRRNAAGVAFAETDKKHLPESVQILHQSSIFSPQIVWILSALQTQLWVQGVAWLPVTCERFEKTPPLDRRRMEAYVCLSESRGLISGCRGRLSLFRDHTCSGQPQIKGIVF